MADKPTFWKRTGLQDLFLPASKKSFTPEVKSLSPDEVYQYILEKFKSSIEELSFANRVVFYHEYIICFNEADYKEFLAHKQGLFGIIVHECVSQFYAILAAKRKAGKTVMPSGSKWVFRLVSHPDYERGDKGFIGKLLPENHQKEENLRVTFIPRQTGIAETLDLNQEMLAGFTYYSEGYYELPFEADLQVPQAADQQKNKRFSGKKGFAKLEIMMPDVRFRGKKVEYLMEKEDLLVSGQDGNNSDQDNFYIPSEWVNSPHLRIVYRKSEEKLYLATFGEKTLLNEQELPFSSPAEPIWTELPYNSKVLLNGIIGMNIYKP